MKLDDVLRKLRKMQKLYESAKSINSEGEAAAAAAAIQRILTEYNLTMEEVGVEEEKKSNEINQAEVSGFNFSSIGGNWEYRLWYVLCKWNFCKCFMYGNSYKRLIMFGSKENMEMVKWMFGMLSERFVEFSKNRWKEYVKTPEYIYAYTKPSMARYQRGYLQGAVEGLDLKLKEISDKDKKQEPEYGTKVTALVLRTSTAIDEYVKEKFGGYGRGRNTSQSNRAGCYSGRSAGRRDGYNTDIYKPIQNNQRNNANSVNLLK